jgi:protein-tyrosine phosphatase
MASPSPQHPPNTISNFRDVAGLTNGPSPSLKPNLFYRSALPATASSTARANLTTTYHIKTIIDLRTDTEILEEQKSNKSSSNKRAPSRSPSPPITTTTTPPPKTTHLSLNGSSYSRALLKRLSYSQTAKLAFLYATSYRTQAISILGTNVMSQRGLSGLAIDTLTHSTSEIHALFTLLAKPSTYPVLVHCTQGKDRTGLVALLVSLLCGASEEGIVRDYERSGVELEPERVERVREIGKIGLPASFAGVEEGWVGVVCAWLEEEWGGVEGYLGRGCGISEETMGGVRSVLMVGGGGGEE